MPNANEKKAVQETESENGSAKPVSRTTLRTKLGAFEDPSPINLP